MVAFSVDCGRDTLSLGAVSNSDVGGHGFPLFSVPCSFDDLDFTDFQQLAEAFHEIHDVINDPVTRQVVGNT